MKHRFKHLLSNLDTTEKASVDIPPSKSIESKLMEATFDSLEDKLSFGSGNGFDDFDDDDDGDDGDDDDEEYLREKLAVAEDEASILSEARVIFQKDPNTGKTLMICRIDEMSVPDEYLDGDTMFKADIIFRSFREFGCPKKKINQLDSSIFKKKNWRVDDRP